MQVHMHQARRLQTKGPRALSYDVKGIYLHFKAGENLGVRCDKISKQPEQCHHTTHRSEHRRSEFVAKYCTLDKKGPHHSFIASNKKPFQKPYKNLIYTRKGNYK
jgi:hypothetical protein